MTPALALARSPGEIVPSLRRHLNSLDVATMLSFYTPDAQIIDAAGRAHVGRDAIARELATYFQLGLPMTITERGRFVTGDVALLILDWSYVGIARDGTSVDIRATSTDVARCGPDGLWRYVIDNPFGAAIASPGGA